MSIRVRKGTRSAGLALITEVNRMRDALVGAAFHASATRGATVASESAVSAPLLSVASANASNLATSQTLANEIKAVLNAHFADPGAHNTAFSPQIATPDMIDLATGQTLANAMKGFYNTHLSFASCHFNNDATVEATTNAVDQTTLNALLNAMKTKINTHMANALAGWHIQEIDG